MFTDNQSPRPLLRGYSHAAAAGVAVVGLISLMLLAGSPRSYVAGAVFAGSLVLLYLVSGAYHSIIWGGRMRSLMQRVDHAMIFVLIAGSYTPFCLLVASDAWGFSVLAVVWSVALAGVVLKVAWPGAPRWLSVLLYATAGWLGLLAGLPFSGWFTPAPLTLLLTGGIVYTIGGLVYAVRRPDPFPRVFGYHEVFHLLVIAGSALHYTLVAGWVIRA